MIAWRGLYLHFPFCQQKCFYCDFTVAVGRQRRQPDYLAALAAEIRAWSAGVPFPVALESIYLGGGTPSLLSPDELATLLQVVRECLPVAATAEVTLEANPGTVDRAKLAGYRAAGVTRLSLGVQSFNDEQLRVLGRLHTATDARQAVEDARAAGFSNLSLDLLAGIPGQTLRSWRATLQAALALEPEHLSAYTLTIEPATEFGRRLRRGQLQPVSSDLAADLTELTEALLGAAGFQRYEIANYARPGWECRHNLLYWRNEPFLWLGTGAHSSSVVARFGNQPRLTRYLTALDVWGGPELVAPGVPAATGPIAWVEPLSPQTQRQETIMLGLRLSEGLDLATFQQRFGERVEERWARTVRELRELGLLEQTNDRLRLTPRGRLLADDVFVRFLLEG
ncbi:MAG: radical SAM family heme chaperone HemW [Chloroflexi bacterium]|nr:radical SAM family heme chaperone HemW [Chloroflexota bacterium]